MEMFSLEKEKTQELASATGRTVLGRLGKTWPASERGPRRPRTSGVNVREELGTVSVVSSCAST